MPAADARTIDRRPRRGALVLRRAGAPRRRAALQIGVTAIATSAQPERRAARRPADRRCSLVLGVAAVPSGCGTRWPLLGVAFVATLLACTFARLPEARCSSSWSSRSSYAVLAGHRRVAAGHGLVVGFVGVPLARRRSSVTRTHRRSASLLALAAWLVALFSGSEVVRSRRDRAREAARAQAEAMRRQAADERLRIARELHDVVAHNMSLINMQAGVALHLIDDEPEPARDALADDQGAEQGRARRAALDPRRAAPGRRGRARGCPTPSLDRARRARRAHAEAAGVDGPARHRRRRRRRRCRATSTWPRSASSRSRSPTSPATPTADARSCGSGPSTDTARHRGRSTRARGATARRTSRPAATASPGCASGPPSVGGTLDAGPRPGARLRRAGRAAPIGGARRDPRPARRRPGAAAQRPALAARRRGRHRGRRRGRRRRRGGRGSPREHRPDVVLMDIRMPRRRRARRDTDDHRRPGARRRADRDPHDVRARRVRLRGAAQSGASGFLVKDTEPAELIRAVRTVAAGDSLLSPCATRTLIEEYATRAKPAALAPEPRRAHRARAGGDDATSPPACRTTRSPRCW